MGLCVALYSSYYHLLHLRLGPLFTSFLAEWWMSFGVWRSCNKAEIQMRLGLTFPSRAHGKHGKNRDLTFPSTCHSTWHMEAGQTRPKANTNLTFTNTCHRTWHMANTAQGKHEFNFYKHIPQHMAHGSRATGKRDLIFIITCQTAHGTWQTEHVARHLANTYSTFTNTNQGTWQTHIQLLQAWFFLTNI